MFKKVTTILILLVSMIASTCSEKNLPLITNPTELKQEMPTPVLEQIDISKMPPLSPKGRMQDDETDALGNKNQIVMDLVAHGKNSIPFLINQLDDEIPMNRHAMNYWYRLYIGDMAHIILTDLFTDETETNSTVPGFGWDEFLERGDDKASMGEEILRRYIRKYGRRHIKERWQKMWNENKESIFWDEQCRCFRLQNLSK